MVLLSTALARLASASASRARASAAVRAARKHSISSSHSSMTWNVAKGGKLSKSEMAQEPGFSYPAARGCQVWRGCLQSIPSSI